MVNFKELIKNPIVIAIVFIILVIAILAATGTFSSFKDSKSNFRRTLITPPELIEQTPPKQFPDLEENDNGGINLYNPVVPEEIGLGMIYPQGSGVGMSPSDSNSFVLDKPGSLLTDYTIPESYGESSLADPSGGLGADQGAHVLRIKSTGNQLDYQPIDESLPNTFASAYDDGNSRIVQTGSTLINNGLPINYTSNYNPNENLKIVGSVGKESRNISCESWYPNAVKYRDFCITEGDIPYGEVVDNKVNPRLVSRWESYTGDYSREAALAPIDGVLYPNLEVLVK